MALAAFAFIAASVRPAALDPLSLIGDAKATQQCARRSYAPLAPHLEMATLAMS